MKLTADNQGRIACRELFPPRKTFDATRQPDGSIRVVELVEKQPRTGKLVRKDGRTYLVGDRPFSDADVKGWLADFP